MISVCQLVRSPGGTLVEEESMQASNFLVGAIMGKLKQVAANAEGTSSPPPFHLRSPPSSAPQLDYLLMQVLSGDA